MPNRSGAHSLTKLSKTGGARVWFMGGSCIKQVSGRPSRDCDPFALSVRIFVIVFWHVFGGVVLHLGARNQVLNKASWLPVLNCSGRFLRGKGWGAGQVRE